MSEDTEFAVISPVERRAEIVASIQAETGIDEAMIQRLMRGFYARVREDPMIGPVFAARIRDWEPHLQRMCASWSSVTLMTGCYHGQPMQKHLPLPVDARHFDRWLALFEATARELCPPKRPPTISSIVHAGSLKVSNWGLPVAAASYFEKVSAFTVKTSTLQMAEPSADLLSLASQHVSAGADTISPCVFRLIQRPIGKLD